MNKLSGGVETDTRGIRAWLMEWGILFAAMAIMAIAGVSCGSGTIQKMDSHSGSGAPVTVTITAGAGYDVSVEGETALDSATLYFKTGENESHGLNGRSDNFHSAIDSPLSYLKVLSKNGDYWFFDNQGTWLPDGYKPNFKFGTSTGKGVSELIVEGTTLTVVASDTMCEVKVGYADDTIQTFYTQSFADAFTLAQSRPNVEAILIKVLADGSKWYFDRDGNTLPLDSKWYQDLD